MTTFSTRMVIAFNAIALAVSVAAAADQGRKSTDLLKDKQVAALLATAQTPADHLTLQKHFLAVAAKYDAKAEKHATRAQAEREPHTGRLMPGSAAKRARHCDRVAAEDRAAAQEARDRASEHGRMASAN